MDYIPRIQKEGDKKSIELAKKYNLYRQEYVDVFMERIMMKEETKKIEKIINENKDKRILILGTKFSGKRTILNNLKIGTYYNDLLDDLILEKYGYVYITPQEKKALESKMIITKGIPLFSECLVDCDLIIFLYINESLLKLRTTMNYMEATSAIAIQNNLKKELKNVSVPIIKIDVLPKRIYPEKMSRNVFVCNSLKEKINLIDKREDNFETQQEGKLLIRFPYINYFNALEELKRKQGFLVIIDESLLPSDIVVIDKSYRRIFKNFNFIYIITEDENKYWKENKYARIKYCPKYFICDSSFSDEVKKTYYECILSFKPKNFQKRKLEELDNVRTFIKNSKTIKTKEIANRFKINDRQVERIMNDLNYLDNNIGYDYSSNEWYII